MRTASTLLVASGLMLASAAAAQQAGSLAKPAPAQIPSSVQSDAERARITMARYAECVVRGSRARVDQYLQTFPGTAVAREQGVKLAADTCLSTGGLTFREPLLRAQIYQVLYRRDFRDGAAVNISAVPQIDYGIGRPPQGFDQAVALRNFGDCVVRANPDQARALVLSNPTSNGETKAFQALMPFFSGCLPKDSTVEFSKSVLRGIVGETLYRLSKNAVSSGAVGSVN